jgi:hypothetical protein
LAFIPAPLKLFDAGKLIPLFVGRPPSGTEKVFMSMLVDVTDIAQ